MEASGPLRAVLSWEEVGPDRSSDAHVLETMLLTVGELGYSKATVREVAERAQITQDSFHRRFGTKDACFARAYEEAADRLATQIIEVSQSVSTGWRDRFQAALEELLRFVAEQPLMAKALLLEVRAARGSSWTVHQEVVDRLTTALDTAREEQGARPNATRVTSGFVAGAIEETICIEIAAGRAEGVQLLQPTLTHLAFLQLFGEE